MKKRFGFVSNSSSSSFILKTAKDRELVEKYDIKYFLVSDLIMELEKIEDVYKTLRRKMDNNDFPEFIVEEMRYGLQPYFLGKENLDELRKLEKEQPGCFITEPYNRDYAYDNNFNFEVFEGDL